MTTTTTQSMTVTAARNKAQAETVLLLANGIKTSRQLAFLRWLAHTNVVDREFIINIETSDNESIFCAVAKGADDTLVSQSEIEETFILWWDKLRKAADRRGHRFTTVSTQIKDQDSKTKVKSPKKSADNTDPPSAKGAKNDVNRLPDPSDKDKLHEYVDTAHNGTSVTPGLMIRFIKTPNPNIVVPRLVPNPAAQNRTSVVNPKNLRAFDYCSTKTETQCWYCSYCGYNSKHCDGGCAQMQKHALYNEQSSFVCQWIFEK